MAASTTSAASRTLTSFGAPPSSFPELSRCQAYGLGMPGDFIQGLGSPSDSFSNKPLGVFWQDSWRVRPQSHVELRRALRRGIPADSSSPRKDWLLPPITPWDCRKASRPTRTTFSRASASRGIPRETARPWFALRSECSMTTPCSASISSVTPRTARPAASWHSVARDSVRARARQSGNLNAIPIFQGNLMNPLRRSVPPSPFPASECQSLLLPNQQQFQSLNTPNSVFLNQNYLNLAQGTFLPLGFQPFGYPQAKNFVYAYSQQANLTIERDLGDGYRLQPGLQLQRWPPSQPSHQRQHHSRRLDDCQLLRGSTACRSQPPPVPSP